MSDLKEGGGRGRGTKRKLEDKAPGGKKSKGELSTPPLPSNGYPKVHRNGVKDAEYSNQAYASVQPRSTHSTGTVIATCLLSRTPMLPSDKSLMSLLRWQASIAHQRK